MRNTLLGFLIFTIGFNSQSDLFAQTKLSSEQISNNINAFKEDVRGPYKNIKWFCKDGSVRDAKDPCPEGAGGIQHATYKNEVVAMSKSNHLFFGQILAATEHKEFWDSEKSQSRLKQYLLGKYLERIDDGWINKKGQYYRGAVQIEDEEAWGVDFYKFLLKDNKILSEHYYLILQSLKDIPHKADTNLSQQMRSESKVISDEYSPFMDIRIKIHGNPTPDDIEKVIQFKKLHGQKISQGISKKLDELILVLKDFHKPIQISSLTSQVNLLSKDLPLTQFIKNYISNYSNNTDPESLATATAEVLISIRKQILEESSAYKRLQLLDIANQLESIIFKSAVLWDATTVGGQIDKVCALSMASAGSGNIELWEWYKVEPYLKPSNYDKVSIGELTRIMEKGRGIVEWSTSMVKAIFEKEVSIYNEFEPEAYGFIDDRVRASTVLQLGQTVGTLGAFIAVESSMTNEVLNLKNQSSVRGLNPGYAYGELVVVTGSSEDVQVSGDKIYIFERAPADLKPVAGIATVAEGNLVSHVQLLARNLGIPNAALSDENLSDLKAHNGKKVFYAVSNKGNVIMKPENQMTAEEKALVTKKTRKEDKIEVPVGEIRLDQKVILDLRDVKAKDSGKSCGPKAANLGQLKALFPDKVVEGFVIPFGIFKDHMDQIMPEKDISYWQFLNDMFKQADSKRDQGVPESEVEEYQLAQLEILRAEIKKIEFKSTFLADLESSFLKYLGNSIGSVPVFLRSDTNMEDLKDFTGAGLNLTIFNAVNREAILQGIKDVWASPYTERSFKWRQKYLLNPENVFPSILVIPSVDVDYSGVVITKGILSGNEKDLTIAFSRGAGGAVDGQAAESYIVRPSGSFDLISPARETTYRSLPSAGGSLSKTTALNSSILKTKNILEILEFSNTIRNTYSSNTQSDYKGAYDVELGFKDDNLWLFQIRPFVENKNAMGSEYLESITPKLDTRKEISLATKIKL